MSYTYSYEEKTGDTEREKHEASLKEAGVKEHEVIEAEVQAVLEDLVERVAWVNCPQEPAVRDRTLKIGEHLEETPVWGMDSYTRKSILIQNSSFLIQNSLCLIRNSSFFLTIHQHKAIPHMDRHTH